MSRIDKFLWKVKRYFDRKQAERDRRELAAKVRYRHCPCGRMLLPGAEQVTGWCVDCAALGGSPRPLGNATVR